MLDRGFVKLHRSILSWEWYDSPDTMRLFLHLLLTVNYEPKKWRGTVIDRGQRVCSLATLAKETRLSVRTVRTCLERLISTNELTRQANPQYTVITINNYAKYQTPTNELTNERQTTDKPTTNDRQLLKKDKESKKVKEIYPTDIISDFEIAIRDFKQMRTKIKAPLTDRAEQLIRTKLDGLSTDEQTKIAILNQSIENGWRGVFPLRENKSTNKFSNLDSMQL